MHAHMEELNALGIKSLHYESPVTDLTVGLCPSSRFLGADSLLPDGRRFFPNLPTEELFTTPDRTKADGYVTTTRPVSVLNEMTESVRLVFKDGKVISSSAEKGEKIMERYLAIDEGSSRLGECALVDEGNAIAMSGKLFASGLYDENASCHLALGAGYPSCLSNKEDACNESLVHTDFMIGSSDMTITAILKNGGTAPLMVNGKFVL